MGKRLGYDASITKLRVQAVRLTLRELSLRAQVVDPDWELIGSMLAVVHGEVQALQKTPEADQ